jgi:hypothetical protein
MADAPSDLDSFGGQYRPRGPVERIIIEAAEEAAAGGGNGTIGRQSGSDATEWTWGARQIVIAVTKGGMAEIRLRPDVAKAAMKTPDVTPSALGSSWVAFIPRVIDRFAEDRLRAWFLFAAREVERLGLQYPDGAPPGWPPD